MTTEYYINDAGRQMRILGMSVWYRLRNLVGRTMAEPEDYYRGSYITDIAKEMLEKDPSLADASDEDGKERCYEYAKNEILEGIKKDLRDFRVEHQNWFSEKTLVDGGLVDKAFQALKDAGYTYEKDGALWFATSRLGDDKDRVLRKSDGSLTYFASDIAYHHNKFERGFDWLIDVWGADHHGYVPRMRAAIEAMGKGKKNFDVVLIQLVNLLINGQPVSMSTRAGTFETLADVVREVGADAARFMFLSRKTDSPVDFDLEAPWKTPCTTCSTRTPASPPCCAALLRKVSPFRTSQTTPPSLASPCRTTWPSCARWPFTGICWSRPPRRSPYTT